MDFTSGRRTVLVITVAALAVILPAELHAGLIRGAVFVDANLDGNLNSGEVLLAGVQVSDGHQIVATDATGRYRLDTNAEFVMLRLTVPSGHWPTEGHWFVRLDPFRLPSKVVNFPLRPVEQTVPFEFVHVTDVHLVQAYLVEVQKFVTEVNQRQPRPAFVVATGDLGLAQDPMSLADPEDVRKRFAMYPTAMSGLSVLLLNVPGNHDLPGIGNPAASRDHPLYGASGFEHLLGPSYFALNYAGHHLIAIDSFEPNVSGPDWRAPGYHEAIPPACLNWLRQDVASVPPEQPVLLFIHEPLHMLANLVELQQILAGHNVRAVFCGHYHRVKQYQVGPLLVYMAGALCGAWWAGPCLDGNPQGYAIVRVADDDIEVVYKALGREEYIPMPVRAGPGDD